MHRLLALLLLVVFTVLPGCNRSGTPSSLATPSATEARPVPSTRLLIDDTNRPHLLEQALLRATDFLLAQQSPDGGWRSDQYATFRDGGALTPLVLNVLLDLPRTEKTDAACAKATAFLAGKVRADGTIDTGPHGLNYPLYTSALAVIVLSRAPQPEVRRARDAWVTFLRQRQLTEDNGWQPADKPYGGWGYCSGIPRKLPPDEFGPPFIESNLSATLYALEALRRAGYKPDDPAIQKALLFVKRCQNFPDNPEHHDPAFDDGGFYFIYDDPVRNKAGVAGKDRMGRERYFAYGSTTADGLRALLLCGLPAEDERVRAARRWLEQHFRADTPPGKYSPQRELDRQAIYYYYCASVALALQRLGIRGLATPNGTVNWAELLVDELLRRQAADGTWSNPAYAYREDDPFTASSLALQALAVCRQVVVKR